MHWLSRFLKFRALCQQQNMRYWSAENPRQLHQTPLHCQRVTVWCAISSVGIIGTYFFEENERAVTVNAARYREMIERIFPSTFGRNGRRGCVVSTRRSHSPHSTGLDGIVERTLPWQPHLSQRRSPLAGRLFEVYRLQRSTADPSSPEDKHSERHRRNSGGHASKSGAKLQKSTQSVHRQWRPSFDRCNFQNCMKKKIDEVICKGKK